MFKLTKGKIITAVVILVLIALVVVFYGPVSNWIASCVSPENIEKFLRETGPLAPVIFILMQAAQVVAAPIPMQVVGLAGGYVFGVLWGTIYSLIGLTIGSALAVWLARKFGRNLVERFVKKETLDKFDHLAEKGGLMAFFLIFLLPALPDDAICFIAGLTNIPIRQIVAMAFLGRLPGLLSLTIIGEQVRYGLSGAWAIGLITAIVVFAALVIIFRPQIEGFFSRKKEEDTPSSDDI
jgi:uncharacterized membrane protein YdjX (TVP38/TMEM64 family)